MTRPSDPGLPKAEDLVAIGRILKPHGVRGEARVQILTDFPDRFLDTEEVFLVSPEGKVAAGRISGARFHQGRVLVHFLGIDSPEAVTAHRHWLVSVRQEDLVDLEEDEYWHFELEGLEVRDEEGAVLGRLREVVQTPAHDLYAIDAPDGEILVPAVAEFVLDIDLEGGVVIVRPPVIDG